MFQHYDNIVVIGVIEYNENGLPKCEICGKHFKRVMTHVRQVHFMNKHEYKAEYGLVKKRGICSKESSLKSTKFLLASHESGVVNHLLNKDNPYKFKSGHKGRVKDLVCPQLHREIVTRWHKVSRLNWQYKAHIQKPRPAKFDNELLLSISEVELWMRSKYGVYFNEDIISEVKLAALKNWYTFSSKRSAMKTWLIQIAKNMYKSLAKKARIREEHSSMLEGEKVSTIELGLDVKVINDLIRELSEKQQQVIFMLIEGCSNEEIQVKFGHDTDYTKTLIYNCRRALKNKLKQISY